LAGSGSRLLDDVTTILAEVGRRHQQDLAPYFPRGSDDRYPWGYVWAVTLPCQECGNRFPITGSLVLRHPLPGKDDLGQSYRITADIDAGTWDVVVHDGPPTGTPTKVTLG